MPVTVQYILEIKSLTAADALKFVGQEEAQKLQANRAKLAVLPKFLRYWNKKYGYLQSAEFLRHFAMYFEQYELLSGIRDLGDEILQQYPPGRFQYVAIGRSPAPLIAYFRNQNENALTIPLSEFRPQNLQWSITDQELPGSSRITRQQQTDLFRHFHSFFPNRPNSNLLVIDYGSSGRSLIAAQEQLQEYFRSQKWHAIEIHALALCKDSDVQDIVAIGEHVGAVRSMIWHPVDSVQYSDQRKTFKQQWHVLPIARLSGDQQTDRQRLVTRALGGQAFDSVAEYASFPILSQNAPQQPTRFADQLNPLDPNERTAYDVLREEIGNL